MICIFIARSLLWAINYDLSGNFMKKIQVEYDFIDIVSI